MAGSVVPSWSFEREGVRGYIGGGGEHGVEISQTPDGRPATRRMCLNVEHYYARSCRDGRFVPRYRAETHSELLDESTVRIVIEPFEAWQVRTTVTYTVLDDGAVEARFHFAFLSDFEGFSGFISNYFHDPTEPHLHLGGEWVQPALTDREHRFWPRGPKEADNIAATHLREARREDDVDLPIDPLLYDYPLMVTPVAGSEWSIVNIVERERCSSLSANRKWNAHDFSLLGANVSEGQEVECRAWIECARLTSLDDALILYEERTG